MKKSLRKIENFVFIYCNFSGRILWLSIEEPELWHSIRTPAEVHQRGWERDAGGRGVGVEEELHDDHLQRHLWEWKLGV